MSHWVTKEQAHFWCMWNGKRTALPPEEEKLYRKAGLKLWRERLASGLDPVTGSARKQEPSSK